MNIHKVLLGAILIKPDLAPYSLPDLEIEHFPADLQPVFAALSGLWNAKGQLDAVEACARYPEQRTAIMECVEECEGEYIAITRNRIEEMCAFVALKKTGCIVRSHGHARPRIVSINSYFEQKCTRKKEGYSNGTETGKE